MIMVIMFYYNFISMIRGKKRLSKLRQDAFDDIENERKRIANDLHDISAFSILKIKENLNKNLNAPIPEIENQLFSSIYDLQNELNLSIENLYPRDLLLHDWQNSIKRKVTRSTFLIIPIPTSDLRKKSTKPYGSSHPLKEEEEETSNHYQKLPRK